MYIPTPNGLQAGHCDAPPPPHFGWTKITFDRISRHLRSIRNFFFSQNGCWRPFWMTENHFRSLFQINTQILFILIFLAQNGCRRPFWMTENHCWSHFSPFKINTQLYFSQNGCRRPFWMTENHFWSHFSPFQINKQLSFNKMAAGGHFGWPNITVNRITGHFRSNRSFYFFLFFFQNGRRRPFWMTEHHFWSHYPPFQINTKLFVLFFFKWRPAAILEVNFPQKQ